MTASEEMSWRRFLILLQGLSANSALAVSLQSEKDNKEPEIQEYDDDKKAEKALYKMLGVKAGDK